MSDFEYENFESLSRIADALERLAEDYEHVHRLRLTECPGCHEKVDPQKGFIIHRSGCEVLWPDPAQLKLPGED